MTIKPITQHPQVQPLTVVLRNICRDYPAGGGILHELLQNADDAGATIVRFVLDPRTYSTRDLIHNKLAAYQGPALLAYNNAVFTETDFENLGRLGDSLKIDDGSTTGKFGRGFNSVFNWTDSPSIISGHKFLILDPHQHWSAGGPVYDYVKTAAEPEMKSHIEAFHSVMADATKPLDGTIIRIPLRTSAQAQKSEIVNVRRETTTSEILDVLRKFADNFSVSGLLFLRNVEQIHVESSANLSIKFELLNCDELKTHRQKVRDATKSALNCINFKFEHSFEIQVERHDAQQTKRTCFVVHHAIKSECKDRELQRWIKEQKLIPWVAVAAQIPIEETFCGSLYTVLPLPLPSCQPIHIHGLFSLSPDRARLHQGGKNIQDNNPEKWNNMLLRIAIPSAWVTLLGYISQCKQKESPFAWWPKDLSDSGNLYSNMIGDFFDIVDSKSLPLWPTDTGYVSTGMGLLSVDEHSKGLQSALRDAQIPVIYAPAYIQERFKPMFLKNGLDERVLKPRTLYKLISQPAFQAKKPIHLWSSSTKNELLQYFLSEKGFLDFVTLPIFRFADGEYRSPAERKTFFNRNSLEAELFNHDKRHTLDVSVLSVRAKSSLERDFIQSNESSSIRYRSQADFRSHCLEFVFKEPRATADAITLKADAAEFVSKSWLWFEALQVDIVNVHISDLWLLPLTNGKYRKIMPRIPSSMTLLAPIGPAGDLLRKLDGFQGSRDHPLIDTKIIGKSSQQMIKKVLNKDCEIRIQDGENLYQFVSWLGIIHSVVNEASDGDKQLFGKFIADKILETPSKLSAQGPEYMILVFKYLQIFKGLVSISRENKTTCSWEWASLSSTHPSIGLLGDPIALPPLKSVQILHAHPVTFERIFRQLGSVKCLTANSILADFVIPAWKNGEAKAWTDICKEEVAALILQQYSMLPHDCQKVLKNLPFIPVVCKNGSKTSTFLPPSDLIDPSNHALSDLFFDDEACVPSSPFLNQFETTLKICGMKYEVDESIINNRAHVYASRAYPLQEIRERVISLLKFGCHFELTVENTKFKETKWLPVKSSQGDWELVAAKNCRGPSSKLLVGSQIPILEVSVSQEWERRFGWHEKLPATVLLAQLGDGLHRKDRAVVDAVLTYINQEGLLTSVVPLLTNTSCVLTSNGEFVLGSKVFSPVKEGSTSCERLHPYLGNVDNKFWDDHRDLLVKIGVAKGPKVSDLIGIQNILESKPSLNGAEIAVAIELLNIASTHDIDTSAGLKVLSDAGKFFPIRDILYNDESKPVTGIEHFNLSHPDIPLPTIKKLDIEYLSEKLMKDAFEIDEDDDEDDEYDRKEEETTRIVDSLTRYPITTTFREYLANADDAHASKISWLLDEGEYPVERLYTPELRRHQGPALLTHNDGVFSKQDFEGFKQIGTGSKRQDKNSIGQFGRGSETMYHWTDVPMILSGESLIILDPQRQVLQKSRLYRQRKAGVILQLSKLKKALLYDQLAPFDGLWDYSKTLDYYPGTIFRFPLRARGDLSALKLSEEELSSHEAYRYLEEYFPEARISLLFLKQISSIDFSVRGKPKSGWSIRRQSPPDFAGRFSSYFVNCSFTNNMGLQSRIGGKDKWWVAIRDLTKEVDAPKHHQKAVLKNAECGLAALIQSGSIDSDFDPATFQVLSPRIFSTLPLSQESDLPVHIHATFLLSGDRRSLVVDEYKADAEGTSWNKYLLENALSTLYLSFLESLGGLPDVCSQEELFKLWPQKCPPAHSGSEIIHSSFWKQLEHSSHQLFPGIDQSDPQNPEMLRIDEAIFDSLSKSHSKCLTNFLLSMNVRLAARLPSSITRKLLSISGLKFVTGPMLRDLLRLEDSKRKLQREFVDNPKVLNSLLNLTMPDEEDAKNLDGCHLLPLMDGSFGVLKLFPSSRSSDNQPYYYATDGETSDLFRFAGRSLILPEYNEAFCRIANSRKFNLETLQHCHISQLLGYRSALSGTNAETKIWLERFWTFWNNNADLSRSLSDSLDGFNIFLATVNGTSICLELSQMETLPALVAPVDAGHLKLCEKIPGIYLFDSKFMSTKSRESEASLKAASSFCRFVKVLRRRAAHQQKQLGSFVTENLDRDDLKVLRRLAVYHYDQKTDELEKLSLHEIIGDLMTMPLWQSCEIDAREFIPAATALLAEDSDYLVPWMKDHSRFIDLDLMRISQTCRSLSNLGIKTIKLEQLLLQYILPLPEISMSGNWESYKALIEKMAGRDFSKEGSRVLQELLNARIAANGTKSLCRASELFDHTDQVFKAAFRGLVTRFLHTDIQQYVRFWQRLRIRRRVAGYLQHADYLACIKAISERLKNGEIDQDAELISDTRVVLSPLLSPNSTTDRFSASDWMSIANELVIVTQTDWSHEDVYRKDLMTSIAVSKRLLCISEVVSHDYVPICWSQTPFAINTPTSEVLHKFNRKGKPSLSMVWRHLDHLSEMVPHLSRETLGGFLGDVNSTYEYLANNIEEAKTTFYYHDKAIWLNLDTFKASLVTLADVQSAWTKITDLVLLSPCDSGRVKAVKPGLMQFQKLLNNLGCTSIHHPTVPNPTLHEGHSLAASLRKLRDSGELLDVTYTSEGKAIQAHRVILAAISSKCAGQFKGNLMVENVIKFDEKEDPDSFLTYHTLSTMIKYAYEAEIDWSEMTASEKDSPDDRDHKLNLLLDLHGGADCWWIPALKSQVEQKIIGNSRLLINIDNVVGVRERAEDVNAKAVESFCARFIEDNRAVVEMGEASKN